VWSGAGLRGRGKKVGGGSQRVWVEMEGGNEGGEGRGGGVSGGPQAWTRGLGEGEVGGRMLGGGEGGEEGWTKSWEPISGGTGSGEKLRCSGWARLESGWGGARGWGDGLGAVGREVGHGV